MKSLIFLGFATLCVGLAIANPHEGNNVVRFWNSSSFEQPVNYEAPLLVPIPETPERNFKEVDYSAPIYATYDNVPQDNIDATIRDHAHVKYHQKEVSREDEKEIEKKKSNAEAEFTVEKIEEVMENTRNGGPSGLVHLGAVSEAVDRPIEVYDEEGSLFYTIGEAKQAEPVKVEYHKAKNGGTVGHYTLPGGKEPSNSANGSNMCLYNVIGEQTGHDGNYLKNLTLSIMEANKEEIAERAVDITSLQMYAEMKLAMGGASYTGKNPDDMGVYIAKSNGVPAFGVDVAGHCDLHVPYRNTNDQFRAVAAETGRKIEVYEMKSVYDVENIPEENVIRLVRHKGSGGSFTEYYTPMGSEHKPYAFHDPLDMNFYKIIAQLTKRDATRLATNVANTLSRLSISDPNKRCLENSIRGTNPKTGYTSQAAMNFVMHHAMSHSKVQEALNKLNSKKTPFKERRRQVVTLSKSELNLPVTSGGEPYATGMIEKKKNQIVQCLWPVESVTFLLQHHLQQEDIARAPVHIHTSYPKTPALKAQCVEGNQWGPFNKKDWKLTGNNMRHRIGSN